MRKLIFLILAFLLILPSINLIANATSETMEFVFVIDGETHVIKQEDFSVPFEITANGKVCKLNKDIVQNQGYTVYVSKKALK